MKATLVAVTFLGLFLCSCTGQKHSAAPSPTSSPAPAPTTSPTPASAQRAPDAPPGLVDLALQVQSPSVALAGTANVYTLTLHNHGPGPATGVLLSSTLPAGLTPLWTAPSPPLCGRQASAVNCDLGALWGHDALTITLDLATGKADVLVAGAQLAGMSWNLAVPACELDARVGRVACYAPRLERGAGLSLRVGVGVEAGVSGELVLTTTVTADQEDVEPADNLVTTTMTVSASASLAAPAAADLALQVSPLQSVIAGQPFTYTYTVANRGALAATDVNLQYPLPLATVLSYYTPNWPLCQQQDLAYVCRLHGPENGQPLTLTLLITGAGEQPLFMYPDLLAPGWPTCVLLKESEQLDVLDCDLGTLKGGQARQVSLTLVAQGVLERAITHTALVSANVAGSHALHYTLVSTVSVQVQADLAVGAAITKPVASGNTLSYTLAVTNAGPSDANGALLNVALPPGASLVSASAGRGQECRQERSAVLVCDLGHMPGGSVASVAIVVALDQFLPPGTTRTLTYSASVAAQQRDPDPTNNEMTASIPIGDQGD